MAEIVKGTLTWRLKERRPMIAYPTRNGSNTIPVPRGQLAPELDAPQADPQQVDLELEGGRPVRIRPVGAPWNAAQAAPPAAQPSHPRQPGPASDPRPGLPGARFTGEFHNPYGFIDAPPRAPLQDGPLGDGRGPGHDRWHEDRYTGRIRVKLTTLTPLLLPDTARVQEAKNGHKTFPVRLGLDDKPYLPPTGIKGMLRSAYEAVTNSRFGVFSGHDRRLGYRLRAEQGLALIPARVHGDELELLPGTFGERGGDRGQALHAAWLPRYRARQGGVAPYAAKYVEDGSLPRHRDPVWCRLRLYQHHRWDRRGNRHVPGFFFWRVEAIARSQARLPRSTSAPRSEPRNGSSWHRPLDDTLVTAGWVCITNQNIDRKHDERVFFAASHNTKRVPLTPALKQAWKELIEDYRELHQDEIARRRKRNETPDHYLGREPGRTAFSRHVYDDSDRELDEGALIYVKLDDSGNPVALYPVTIARDLHAQSPRSLLPDELFPAERAEQLSPAERVFGWVRGHGGGGQAAYRGNLRIGAVRCASEQPIHRFADPQGLPLAILGAPKPAQGRFYLIDKQRGPLDSRDRAEAGYRDGNRVRGRKFYPHHRLLDEAHWRGSTADHTQQPRPRDGIAIFQEYRRPEPPPEERGQGKSDRDDQNRSILGWVKPGTVFTFDIDVTNLATAELGALLWLLDLNEGLEAARYFHRLGGGKPLGFGSVRIELDGDPELSSGAQLAAYYKSFDLNGKPKHMTPDDRKQAVDDFKNTIATAYGADFEQVPFIRDFLTAAAGFNDRLPIHYPRVRENDGAEPIPPSRRGENFKWFQENDDQRGPRLALRNLADDRGLPLYRDGQFRNRSGGPSHFGAGN
jgi:CRISPR-associated protein (TIGR03986 family)